MKTVKFFWLLAMYISSTPHARAANETLKIALNWKAEPQFGGFYAAKENKHFEKQKLNVEILEGGAGAPVAQLVASGKADFGVVTGDEIIVARARGLPLVALFAVYQTFPQGIMVHESRKFKTLGDVFSSEGSLALQKGVPFSLWLEKKYAHNRKVKIVPYTGGIASFIRNEKFAQQCFVTSEPLAARREGQQVRAFLIADSGYNPYTTVLITTLDKLKNNATLTSKVVQAVSAGWIDYLANDNAINNLMHKLNPSMDAETFNQSALVQKDLIQSDETKVHGLGYMNELRWDTLASQLVEVGVIKPNEKLAGKEYFSWLMPSLKK